MWHLYLTLHDGDKAFLGSLIGAFLGTLGAFSLALFVRWRDHEDEKKRHQRELLRHYNKRLVRYEVQLNQFIAMLSKGIRLADQIKEISTPGNFMMTLPRSYEVDSDGVGELLNSQLVNGWTTLALRSSIVSEVVQDFNNYYTEVRSLVMRSMLSQGQLNTKVAAQDAKTLQSFSADVSASLTAMYNQACDNLALIQLHGQHNKIEKNRFKTVKELEDFEINEAEIVKISKKLRKEFAPGKLFNDPKEEALASQTPEINAVR